MRPCRCNRCHKWHWVTTPLSLQMFSGLGIGINDAMEMQRQWNVTLSLIFEQIRSSALPGWVYDKDAIQPDDVRLLGPAAKQRACLYDGPRELHQS